MDRIADFIVWLVPQMKNRGSEDRMDISTFSEIVK